MWWLVFIFCFHALLAGGIVQNFYPRETFANESYAEENIKTKNMRPRSCSATVCLSQTNNLAISGQFIEDQNIGSPVSPDILARYHDRKANLAKYHGI